MKNKFFPDEDITENDLYFMCYMVERVARELHQRNKYVVNKIGYEELEKNSSAKTMRALCSIRNAIMQKPGSIYQKMRMEIKNLDTIPELIDPSLFEYLNGQKIRIVTGTQIKELTEYISFRMIAIIKL